MSQAYLVRFAIHCRYGPCDEGHESDEGGGLGCFDHESGICQNCRGSRVEAKAMKAMKAAGSGALTMSQAYAKTADAAELKPKQVKAVVAAYIELAASELKKNGKFKL